MMHLPDFIRKNSEIIFDVFILAVLFLFLLSYFHVPFNLLGNTPTGGDIPAHTYLLKHLKESLFNHGTVISWARGWWCGFPMYQYYFFFPYMIMAVLSLVIPMNMAFNMVSLTGVLFLPTAVYFSLKRMKFNDPIPLIGSISMVPFLFVDTHTMWGVNIYSTLSGEISNSISFLFFVLFLGWFYNDMEEARFRFRTVVLFTLVFYSHFFTSVIAGASCFFLLFLFGRNKFKKRMMVYLKTNALTFLLIAWWAVPLSAKLTYSMEMGGDWDVTLWKTFPAYTSYLLPLALIAAVRGILKKRRNLIFILPLLTLSILAFYTGGKINASFTNIRFWPFIFYSLMILASVGAGYLIETLRAKEILVIILLVSTLLSVGNSRNNIRAWIKWNYEGLEEKTDYLTFRDLILPLDNTPGRLANDIHKYNSHFGSVRIFETIPYLINKDILEGGIVNSATGSMFSYYIQGETSSNCAGFPTVVNPPRFNMENGTKHLKLANVKHFIAYWDKTRKALSQHPEWKLLKTVGPYQLFELTGNSGNYVYIPENKPMAVKTKYWKESAMEWIYTIEALDTPFILLYDKNKSIPPQETTALSLEEYHGFLSNISPNTGDIPVWLTLGPFYYPSGLTDEEAVDLDILDIGSLKPKEGYEQAGHKWKSILRRGPVFLGTIYQPKFYFINYNYVNIYSKEKQKVLLHYSNDDHARIYLNGELIIKTGFTGIHNYRTKEIMLKKGKNALLYKLQQNVGNVFFHAKLTDLGNRPLKNISYLKTPATHEFRPERIYINRASAIREEEFGDRQIRFKTRALNQPHIIKCSYFPNWKVKGAGRIYHVTPNFMLVYPEKEEVTLYYGSLPSDILGRLLTLVGIIIFIGTGMSGILKKRRK